MECRLTLVSSAIHESFTIPQGATTIGRESDNDVQLMSESVSRYHAKLTNTPDECIVEDLKSRNGTFVDGIRLLRKPISLRDGMEVRFGHCVFRFEVSTGAPYDDSILTPDGYVEWGQQETVAIGTHPEDGRKHDGASERALSHAKDAHAGAKKDSGILIQPETEIRVRSEVDHGRLAESAKDLQKTRPFPPDKRPPNLRIVK